VIPQAQWALEAALVLLLAATLFHALRLERALGVLKRDRAALEQLVAGFNASTAQAESGIARLHEAAEGAGRQIARQMEQAGRLREDMRFLMERGEAIAERLEGAVRAGKRASAALPPPREAPALPPEALPAAAPRVRSQAERDLLRTLQGHAG
jgi:hypothetical protein